MAETVLVVMTEVGSDGSMGSPSLEAAGLGAALAESRGSSWTALVATPVPAPLEREAAERGAAGVYSVRVSPDRPAGDQILGAVDAVAAARDVNAIVVNRGSHVLDVAPRAAARLGGGCVMGVTELREHEGELRVVASIYGGAARGVYRFTAGGPPVLSPAPGAAEPPGRLEGREAPVETLTGAAEGPVSVVEPLREPEGPRLEDSPVVVSGGRGIKKAENYALIEGLASALGGLAGASRAIVDDSWATPSQQVGLTGKVVTPRLYVAAGISGASQHMAGCSNSKVLVAINTDPEAPIFRYAHFGVVDDCLEVLPELIRLARSE